MYKLFLLAALILSTPASAASAPPLTITGGWIEAVAPGVPDTSAFMTLHNSGKVAVVITGGFTNAAGMLMTMHTVTQGSGVAKMSGMTNAASLNVPAGKTLTLKPDGDHLMLMGLQKPLKVGDKVLLKLKTSAGSLTVTLPVRKP